MSARLIKALAMGKVVVRNLTHSEVIIHYPPGEDNLNFSVVPPMGKLDLTDIASVKQLRKSSNLQRQIKDGFLVIE